MTRYMREKTFCSVKPQELKDNPFKSIGSDWMLICAGTIDKYNMMTASWGGWGILWHKSVAFCVVRPGRYTYQFMENNGYFSLSYFDKKYKKALNFCGTKSGRDVNKPEAVGFTLLKDRTGAVYPKEARLVIILKKIYFQQIDPRNFLDPAIEDNYPNKDYHRMYIGEVVRCLIKK